MSRPCPVTLAIPAWNAAATLGVVLTAARAQTRPLDELLVVDDGSSDATARIAERAGARVLGHPRNLGLAEARNTALAEARGELIVFVDADAAPEPELVARLTGALDDERVAGAGGQVLEPAAAAPSRPLPDRWRARFWRQTQGERRLDPAPFLIGACFAVRRRLALGAGGFDAAFRRAGEDVELSLRLLGRGCRLVYEPAARVVHLRQDTLPSLLHMVHLHAREQLRAHLRHAAPSAPLLANALRWGVIAAASSLRRERSLGLAALSPLCQAAHVSGCLCALLSTRRALAPAR